MTTQWIRIIPGPPVIEPRAVELGLALLRHARAAAQRVGLALHQSGQRRAARVLRERAEQVRERDPELARFLLDASRFDARADADPKAP